ncbi:MAG: DNA repair protein RadA [Candidatus Eisenbacteria sp.]|nr:DNA repair protein RadA [Candidatus Eisenbacteria bacterium]
MARRKRQTQTFLCRNCGEDFSKWFGKCPNCGEWNTLVSYRPPSSVPGSGRPGRPSGRLARGLGTPARPSPPEGARPWSRFERDPRFEAGVQLLSAVPARGPERLSTGLEEFDRVLGGGLVPGSVVLIGGDPGVGKSTLLLQAASNLVTAGHGVLYVSGEESAPQTKLRAVRLSVSQQLPVMAEGDLERVLEAISEGVPALAVEREAASGAARGPITDASVEVEPAGGPDSERQVEAEPPGATRPVEVVFIDSIQSTYLPDLPSAPGSVLQVREGALQLTQMAKRKGVTVLLVGHVTKEGNLAGPRTLEHIVDAVLSMEGERFHAHRLLRSAKNRFGSVHEIGVFDMRADGLHEVSNPSLLFLGEEAGRAAGSAIVAGTEGSRSLLVEVQALVHPTRYGIPQRIATGFDGRRLAILLAVLVKRGGVDVTNSDVFVNIVGGLRIEEPGVDLGVLLAIASSARDRPTGDELATFGEVGLGGEVRRVSDPERRIREAVRLGFRRVMVPAATQRDLEARDWSPPAGCRLLPVATLSDALQEALGERR